MSVVFLDIEKKAAPKAQMTGVNDFAIEYIKDNPIIPIIVVSLIGISLYLVIRNNQLKKSFGVSNGQAASVATMGL